MEQPPEDPRPNITCPECHKTSWHPGDVENLYCGFCRWWTSDPALAPHKPRHTDSDGMDLTVPERLEEAARLLRAHPASPEHAEALKLLSLAALRLARLEAAAPADWGDVASPYLTLSTLGAHLATTDYFARVPPP